MHVFKIETDVRCKSEDIAVTLFVLHLFEETKYIWFFLIWFNSAPPSAAYMRQWTVLALVQVMACHLFGA